MAIIDKSVAVSVILRSLDFEIIILTLHFGNVVLSTIGSIEEIFHSRIGNTEHTVDLLAFVYSDWLESDFPNIGLKPLLLRMPI